MNGSYFQKEALIMVVAFLVLVFSGVIIGILYQLFLRRRATITIAS